MKNTFKYYVDAGHGWIVVPIKLLAELGLLGEISQFSYMKGKTAYLEEDCDAQLFVDTFQEKYGVSTKQITVHHEPRSRIRGYDRYHPSVAQALLN